MTQLEYDILFVKNWVKVRSVKYFNTNWGGVGYKCETNVDSMVICNDGNGGATYAHPSDSIGGLLSEQELEQLINEFEFEEKYEGRGIHPNAIPQES